MGYELDVINEIIEDVYTEGLYDTYGMNKQELSEQSQAISSIDKQIQKLDAKLRTTPEGKKRAGLMSQRNALLQQRQNAAQQYKAEPAEQPGGQAAAVTGQTPANAPVKAPAQAPVKAPAQTQAQAPKKAKAVSPAVAAKFRQGTSSIVSRANQGDQKARSLMLRMIQQMGV